MLTTDAMYKVGVLVFDMHLKIRVPVVKKAESTITTENIPEMAREVNDIVRESLNWIFEQEHGIQNTAIDVSCDVLYVQN